jgi:hypothetical protein
LWPSRKRSFTAAAVSNLLDREVGPLPGRRRGRAGVAGASGGAHGDRFVPGRLPKPVVVAWLSPVGWTRSTDHHEVIPPTAVTQRGGDTLRAGRRAAPCAAGEAQPRSAVRHGLDDDAHTERGDHAGRQGPQGTARIAASTSAASLTIRSRSLNPAMRPAVRVVGSTRAAPRRTRVVPRDGRMASLGSGYAALPGGYAQGWH